MYVQQAAEGCLDLQPDVILEAVAVLLVMAACVMCHVPSMSVVGPIRRYWELGRCPVERSLQPNNTGGPNKAGDMSAMRGSPGE
jgi:hypothetical protein